MTQIPFPGSSGTTPTGAIQFQDDWPGLFIRGDTAIALLPSLRALLAHTTRESLPVSCLTAHFELSRLADIIEREVVVRQGPVA